MPLQYLEHHVAVRVDVCVWRLRPFVQVLVDFSITVEYALRCNSQLGLSLIWARLIAISVVVAGRLELVLDQNVLVGYLFELRARVDVF